MQIRLFGTVNDSIVDGPGYRFTVFVQGCPHHCPGCHNPDSHPFDGGKDADTEDILGRLRENPLLSGLTLSGGEPFCQPEACQALAQGAHALGLSVWCYTGYTLEALLAQGDAARLALLEQVDVLVDGPYVAEERSLEVPWRGSRNQRLLDVKRSLDAGQAILWEMPTW